MANQKITPFLWFDNQAEEAANFYVSVFKDSKVTNAMRNGETVLVASFSLGGQSFSALNGGPQFKINPSISIFVICETEAEIDAAWQKLIDGGSAMIPIGKYPWSEKYGWVQDRYGISWQLSLANLEEGRQKFTPSFLFTGEQRGKAEAAIQFYAGIFSDTKINVLSHYKPGGQGAEGSVEYAQFDLLGQPFIAMDNPNLDQNFTFNEAFSFVVNCKTQEEVDYYWGKLTADGGEESMCGWLKDKFGVSWQIIPETLPQLLSDPDPVKAQQAMNAMLKMRKIEISQLTQASDSAKSVLTVENTVNVPVEKVWKFWTEPEHLMQWNNASDDWHTPKAMNDLRVGGHFACTMAAKDGSFSFEFGGVYDAVVENQHIAYTMGDGRKVDVKFEAMGDKTKVTEQFDAERMNSLEMQQAGWQAILDNFKKYAEAND